MLNNLDHVEQSRLSGWTLKLKINILKTVELILKLKINILKYN